MEDRREMGIHDPRLLARMGKVCAFGEFACCVVGGLGLIVCEVIKVDVRVGGEDR